MREISCPLKKSWKLRWRKARRVVAHLGRGVVFTSVASAMAEFCWSVTRLDFFTSSVGRQEMKATGKRIERWPRIISVGAEAVAVYFPLSFPQLIRVTALQLPRRFDPR